MEDAPPAALFGGWVAAQPALQPVNVPSSQTWRPFPITTSPYSLSFNATMARCRNDPSSARSISIRKGFGRILVLISTSQL